MTKATKQRKQCGECGTGLILGQCFRCMRGLGRTDSWLGVVLSTDWLLLRSQKQALVRISGLFKDDSAEGLALEGLIGFLDAVQDAAALETDEFTVFGKGG